MNLRISLICRCLSRRRSSGNITKTLLRRRSSGAIQVPKSDVNVLLLGSDEGVSSLELAISLQSASGAKVFPQYQTVINALPSSSLLQNIDIVFIAFDSSNEQSFEAAIDFKSYISYIGRHIFVIFVSTNTDNATAEDLVYHDLFCTEEEVKLCTIHQLNYIELMAEYFPFMECLTTARKSITKSQNLLKRIRSAITMRSKSS